jgi:hypothetical protein
MLVIKRLAEIDQNIIKYEKIIDLSVYKIKQNFRLIGHHKENEQEFFEPVQGFGRQDSELYSILDINPRIFHVVTYFPTSITILPVVEQVDDLINMILF